jgi:hypothetical protein
MNLLNTTYALLHGMKLQMSLSMHGCMDRECRLFGAAGVVLKRPPEKP